MEKYEFIADYVTPEVITFNPSCIENNSIILSLDSDKLYVKRVYSNTPSSLMEISLFSKLKVNKRRNTIKFMINSGEFYGEYAIYDMCYKEGIDELIRILKN